MTYEINASVLVDDEQTFEFDDDVSLEEAKRQAKDRLFGDVIESLNTDPDRYIQARLAHVPIDGPHVTCTFHPQAWNNDYAIGVDPGPQTFDVPLEDALGDEDVLPEDNCHESDVLREHPNAPDVAREWSGPFFVTVSEVKQ